MPTEVTNNKFEDRSSMTENQLQEARVHHERKAVSAILQSQYHLQQVKDIQARLHQLWKERQQ